MTEIPENKLVTELEYLQEEFTKTTQKLIKDVKRQDKIMIRSDRRQQKEYDELMALKIEIEETQREVVFTMGSIGESRSKETGNHVKRVAEYSYLLAKYYGLPEKECEMLKQASPMHDIGKVAIPDAVLNKPGRFNDEERAIMDT
ncbi:MAG: HD domain-containing protein, partial [Campylobacterota bacterium]|nr:HD domain-containing protein [Campylobacterota bacterium]